MRPATKHWLLLIFLVLSLTALAAFIFWQIGKARREGPTAKPSASHPALASHGRSA
jgi:hypothetical protein